MPNQKNQNNSITRNLEKIAELVLQWQALLGLNV